MWVPAFQSWTDLYSQATETELSPVETYDANTVWRRKSKTRSGGAGASGTHPGQRQQYVTRPQPLALENHRLMCFGPIAADTDIDAKRNVERHHSLHALTDQDLYLRKLGVRHLE